MADFSPRHTLPDEFAAEVENWRRLACAQDSTSHNTDTSFSWSGTDQDLEEVISKASYISPFEIRARVKEILP